MKILQINKFLYRRGGADAYVLDLGRLLQEQGQEVIYFSQKNPKNQATGQEKYFLPDLELGKFSLSSLVRLPRIFWSFQARKKIKKLIQDEKPDLVHLHNIYHQISPSILPVIKKNRLPAVMTVHDFKLMRHDYTLYAADERPQRSPLADWLLRLEFNFHRWLNVYDKNIDIFIAPSKFVKAQLLAHGYERKKIMVIPHFVELNNFIVRSFDDKNKYLLYFGRLDSGKGVADLIRAFSKISAAGVKLKIAGSGPEGMKLQRLAEKSGLSQSIEFLGQRDKTELAEIIAGAMFVVAPSKVHETFGLSVLEAFALGKPVIAYKTGALSELIKTGKNGYLVEAGNVDELAKKINYLIGHPKLIASLGSAARKTAEKFSPEQHLKQILNLYRKLIKAQKHKNTKAQKHKSTKAQKHKNKKTKKQKNKKTKKYLTGLIVLILLLAVFIFKGQVGLNLIFKKNPAVKGVAQVNGQFIMPAHSYPKLVNLFWRAPITRADAEQLAKWDIVVLDMNAQTNSADTMRYLRQLNPSIVILAYTSANEVPRERLPEIEPSSSGLWHDLAAGAKARWQLKTVDGQNVIFWPGDIMMNLYLKDENGKTYGDYLAGFYQNKILSTGLWDGLYFDNVWQNATWVNKNMDLNGDGIRESEDTNNKEWQEGYRNFFKDLRDEFGGQYLIVGNGDGAYQDQLNGRMLEGFPLLAEGGWSGSMAKYASANAAGDAPRVNMINSDTNNTGNWMDWQKMRFGLTSALLSDGYFSFDYGTNLREQLWWYDEYDAKIGQPKSDPFNLLDPSNHNFKPGVWQRDFTGGVVLVNSTNQTQTVSFNSEYEKIHGTQDKTVNNGAVVSQLTLAPSDGILLLRPLAEIDNAVYINGSFARIFSGVGQIKRNGFFAYNEKFQGGNKIIKTDIDGNGKPETVVATANAVSVYDSAANQLYSWQPYGQKFSGGISLAVADINGDGQKEIITAPEKGGSNLIKIYSSSGQTINSGFYAFGKKWPGQGAVVAAGDINGDGQMEIAVGAGIGGGPHIRIFDHNGQLISSGFFAFDSKSRGGVNLALGDVNGDGKKEIIAGQGWGGGPQVKIFSASGQLQSQWQAYEKNNKQGVKVTAADIDGDGKDEAIALTTNVFTTR